MAIPVGFETGTDPEPSCRAVLETSLRRKRKRRAPTLPQGRSSPFKSAAADRYGTGRWRPRPESNRGARICSPLRNHSATRPSRLLSVNAPLLSRRLSHFVKEGLSYINGAARRKTISDMRRKMPWSGRHRRVCRARRSTHSASRAVSDSVWKTSIASKLM
jgi:hypothetical protein